VPDAEYTQHENTFLHFALYTAHLRKRNHKSVKLKSDKGRRSRKARRGEAGRRGARLHKVTFTLDFGT